jgi:hypothetical protein
MAIPASQIVKINPRVVQASGTDLVLNGMFLTTNGLVPTGGVMGFSTADDVASFFGSASEEYRVASVYFGGYKNSFRKPRQAFFGSRVNAAAAAWLRGAKYTGTLAQLQAVTSGTLDLSINGTSIALTSLDFSSATSLSGCATVLQTALASALASTTCAYSSQTGAFQITSPITGEASTITYAEEGTLATLLGLTQAKGATLSQGSDALDVADNMRSIRAVTENWATFTFLYSATDDEILDLSAWAGAQGVEYLFVVWSTDSNLKNQVDTTSIAYKLKEANAGATTLIFGDQIYAAFIMGEAASIDWDRTQGAINFAFKSADSLAPTIDNATEATTLLGKHCNLYGTYATRNDEFVWLYDANMFGDYRYIDPFINAVWFNNSLQVAIMNGLEMSPRVPYNEDGYTLIRSWCQDPINRARKNGVIDPGVTLSEAQKAELIREAGLDITSNLQTDGYYLQVVDAGPQVRTTRDTPNVSLWYAYGGSVNRIEMASTLFI